jgi:hypothetical protein
VLQSPWLLWMALAAPAGVVGEDNYGNGNDFNDGTNR